MRLAVAVEDEMGYMEPPRLYQPLRQCLAYLLLVVLDKPGEAEVVSARDLVKILSWFALCSAMRCAWKQACVDGGCCSGGTGWC